MRLLRRSVAAVVVLGTLLAGMVGWSAPASATLINVAYWVKATTTLAKLNQTVNVPMGSFHGYVNLNQSTLTGNLYLPPASTTVDLAGIGLATATFKLAQAKPVAGNLDLTSGTVTATSVFNVLVTSVEPLGLPVNLVGNSCGTSTPVSVTFTGPISFSGSSSFSGTYTIPPLQNCGALTPALNLLIPGPGNVFNARFSPA